MTSLAGRRRYTIGPATARERLSSCAGSKWALKPLPKKSKRGDAKAAWVLRRSTVAYPRRGKRPRTRGHEGPNRDEMSTGVTTKGGGEGARWYSPTFMHTITAAARGRLL